MTPHCPWSTPAALRYSEEGSVLLDSIETLVGPAHPDLWRPHEVPPARAPQRHRPLVEIGELRLKTYSIHGLAPLVVLFTEAPASASDEERRYRRQLTSQLLSSMERLGVSLFSLHPAPQSSDSFQGDQMMPSASKAFEVFRQLGPADRPQVIIGFADGATAAGRLLIRDSLSAALVALVPSTKGDGATAGHDMLWQELLSPRDRPRAMLVLESMCSSTTTWLAEAGSQRRRTVLMLPQYDGWLSRKTSTTCPATPAHAVGMDYELMSLVIDWLNRRVIFPQ